MKIYTRGGDSGTTNLIGNDTKQNKSDLVFEVLGMLDELSAFLGAVQNSRIKNLKTLTLDIQSDLLGMGAFIAGKDLSNDDKKKWDARLKAIEQSIDDLDSANTPLSNFILPGGSDVSSKLHICRAVCRRLERVFVLYSKSSNAPQNEVFLKYLNRLSDLFFVAARYANTKLGVKDLIWNN